MTDTHAQTVLITGANGGVGRLMRPRLARAGRTLRLLDVVRPEPAAAGEAVEIVEASVTDEVAMREACAGVDAIIHLGGISVEAPWADILAVNIDGTRVVLEAARDAGVPRVVLASSNHAVGFYGMDDAFDGDLPADRLPRPDTYYGVSKVAMEGLGSLFHDRYGIDVTCLRIGSCFEKPWDRRSLWTWMSPADGARLFEACLSEADGGEAREPGFRIVWGISRNTRSWWSLAAGEAIGYHPQDDSEVYAAELLGDAVDDEPQGLEERLAGGKFCLTPLGQHMK
ncbi:NAD-dependent epimerase/dehydratase family protein [Nocardioides albertanoniae]|uniref:NAD-dependent epimerase/dehydratase family protein n=1 Tax=Nocardioides albertanoniae TaxID=1175486 RepID=A0A543A4R1_9ACTN|nr:NAD(P)-dependent oxidoreductase [Nocardioides albertanoniae]TQL67591.1 NAD-dependent epimerase/dehydratase family protein [Nocardioides albertanoniae]